MRFWIRGLAALLSVLLLAWAGYGYVVYSRNKVPETSLPVPSSPPPNNSYEQLIECVRSVRDWRRLAALEKQPDYGSIEQKQAVVQANREVLDKLHRLIEAPSQVTRLYAVTGDPTMEDYRHLARLVVAEGKMFEQQAQYGRALDTYIDGLVFTEKVMRGGNTLHLVFNFAASIVIFQAIPSIIPHLSAEQAQHGAQRLERLLKEEYPLHELLTQEFREQLIGWKRTADGMAMRGFRLDFPKSQPEKELLFRPKAPITRAAQQYVQQWIEQVKRPYPEQQVIEYPPALASMPEGMVVRAPSELALHIARYTYVRTRLRLLYTALRLEAYRKARGCYPASLKDLGNSPYFIDPFSNKPFVYRPQGNGYVLYSLGPNSIDDGGTPFPEGKLNRAQPGDIGLVPNFPSRPS